MSPWENPSAQAGIIRIGALDVKWLFNPVGKRNLAMKGLFRSNIKRMRTNLSTLIWFEILYKLLLAVTLYPTLVYLLDLAIHRAGILYLTNRNLQTFVTKPLSIVILLVILILIILYSLFEIVTLTVLSDFNRQGIKTNVVDLFFAGLRRLPRFLRPGNILSLLLVLVTATFFNLPFASTVVYLTGIPDYLNTYFGSHHIFYILAVPFGVLLLLVSGVFLFSFQYQILENMKFKEALRQSRKLLKGETVREVSGILCRYLFLALLFLLFYAVLLLAAAFITRAVSPEAARVTIYLTTSRYIGSFYAILLYFFFTPFGFSIIAGIYFSQKEKHGEVLNPYPYRASPRRQRRLEDILLAAALFAGIVLNYGMIFDTVSGNVQSNIQAIRMPMISAHRGSSEQAPENTLAAVAAAAEDMADYAEIDVRATSDGVVVLLHDENLKRTTGIKKMIWNVTYEDASQLSMSKWYNGNLITEKIPTLDEVLKFANNRIRLNIEIKASPHSPDLVASVVNLIRENGFEDQCVITSFEYSVLSEVKELDPNLKTGIIITAAIANYTNLPDVDFYSMSSVFLSKSKVENLHLRGYEVFAWGVYDTNTMRRMISIGVDNMIVSDPLVAKKVVYAENANLIVLRIADAVFGPTDIKEKSVVKIFLPYW